MYTYAPTASQVYIHPGFLCGMRARVKAARLQTASQKGQRGRHKHQRVMKSPISNEGVCRVVAVGAQGGVRLTEGPAETNPLLDSEPASHQQYQ